MKPFNLEAAKRGDAIQCCGMSAKFVAHEPEAAPYQRVIYLGHGNQLWAVDANGGGSHHTLTMVTKRRTVWVNFYTNPSRAYYYNTEGYAEDSAMNGRIGGKAYPVEVEE